MVVVVVVYVRRSLLPPSAGETTAAAAGNALENGGGERGPDMLVARRREGEREATSKPAPSKGRQKGREGRGERICGGGGTEKRNRKKKKKKKHGKSGELVRSLFFFRSLAGLPARSFSLSSSLARSVVASCSLARSFVGPSLPASPLFFGPSAKSTLTSFGRSVGGPSVEEDEEGKEGRAILS